MEKYLNISITDMLLDPDNARFFNPDEIIDNEESALNLMVNGKYHLLQLAKDISENGLNPTEIPLVVKDSHNSGKYIVVDGNRRIASIKAMTQYKDQLEKIGISKRLANQFRALPCEYSSITCVVRNADDPRVNELLEKLHTAPEGISRLHWIPQARDKHMAKSGKVTTPRLALIYMLRHSIYTSNEIKTVLSNSGWASKFGRLIRNIDVQRFFGIEFEDGTNNVMLNLVEEEVVKGLSQVVSDLAVDFKKYPASEFFQKVEDHIKYLDQFPPDKKPNQDMKVERITTFNVKENVFEYGEYIQHSQEKHEGARYLYENKPKETEFPNKSKSPSPVYEPPIDDSPSLNADKSNPTTSQKEDKKIALGPKPPTQTTLIPKDHYINITNTRTAALYKELQNVSLIYENVIACSLRSLIEFSLNSLFECKKHNYANNRNVGLEQKLDKAVKILESKYGKHKLQNEFPAIYASIDSNKDSMRIDSIPVLHILIHNYNYHPTAKELCQIYNNYRPFLEILWEYIDQN